MGFPSFFFKDLNKNPMIFFGEKGVCIKNIFMDFDQNKANGFYLLFKKKKKFWVSKDPMIFMKMHISFRNFAHSKDFF